METGTVKFFKVNNQGGFGFIRLPSDEELYFQRNDGGPVEVMDNELVIQTLETVREPQEGERINFARSSNRKGPKAAPWCFADEWLRESQEAAQLELEAQINHVESLLDQIQRAQRRGSPLTAQRLLADEKLQKLLRPTSHTDDPDDIRLQELRAQAQILATAVASGVEQERVKWTQNARALVSRFTACIGNGNTGGARAALRELSSPENRQGLGDFLPADTDADVWLTSAHWQADKLAVKRQSTKKKARRKVPC